MWSTSARKTARKGWRCQSAAAGIPGPDLQNLIAPFFASKDTRDLESLLWELYRWQDNYKMYGLALWSPQAFSAATTVSEKLNNRAALRAAFRHPVIIGSKR